ncbi:charged multivesicular body protein 1b [Rozella allomycis CSF55]|uniref:Charged multivesicular body protein 1b n=1 Tax=Rozella allomycis (strain CSF55) TaxID=988480 RepID=A0A075B400_ROZAC|nr:hypothetical protein O9G_003352 [Rozella allomycis CSF55]RKP19945.1 charged multivesicular body protein 1b [Rozella allomycis CSF55]|eukprot:EPZ35734.1 hypothetical protein O9G_003352 [Rozella allomycis CSF55]
MEGAKIYAQNAIRKKNEGLNMLRLSSRVDAVASRVQTAVSMRQVTQNMAGVVKGLDAAMSSMNLEKISMVMDQFEKQFEDIDVQTQYMEGSIGNTTALTTPQEDVDTLIQQVADEHGLEVKMDMGVPGSLMEKKTEEKDELGERLAKLRSGQ